MRMYTNEIVSFLFLNKQAFYEVTSQIIHGDKQQQIRYTTEITKDDGWTRTYYVVKRNPQVVFPVVDNPYMEALALTTTLWNEIKLSVNSQGEIKKIVNLKEIQEYWTEVLKYKLTQMYVGSPITAIVLQLEQIVMDESQFIEKIYQDTFFYHWIRYNPGEYIKNYHTQEYIKIGRSNYSCQIEKTATKGRLIKGEGKKSTEELAHFKKKWKLDPDKELSYKEQLNCEYNRDGDIIRLIRKEVYTYQGSVYHSTVVEIKKKIK